MKLERVTSNSLLPSLPRLRVQEDLLRLIGDTDEEKEKPKKKMKWKKDANDNVEEVVIAWQEKVFNRVRFLRLMMRRWDECRV